MARMLSLALILGLTTSQAFASYALIWDRTYSRISPYKDTNTYFEKIEQIHRVDYVQTRTIGLTWSNVNGYCRSLYRPRVLIREDELSSRYFEVHETDSPQSRVRTRNKQNHSRMPGLFYYRIPYGRKIAEIKLMGIQKSKISPSRRGSYLGECRFKVYALDPQFGTYN